MERIVGAVVDEMFLRSEVDLLLFIIIYYIIPDHA